MDVPNPIILVCDWPRYLVPEGRLGAPFPRNRAQRGPRGRKHILAASTARHSPSQAESNRAAPGRKWNHHAIA